jgi:two-component system cell cycle sensor histidine kinase/response regulator CckA
MSREYVGRRRAHTRMQCFGASMGDGMTRTERFRSGVEEHNRELAAIVSSSDDAILSKDLSGIILTWNKGAQYLYGYTAEEIIGQPITTIVPEHLHEETRQFLCQIAAGKSATRDDTVRRRKDGSLVQVSLVISPVRDPEGHIIGASTTAHDITERKRAETALREKEHILSESQRIACVGSWTYSLTGKITWSGELYRIYGVTPATFTPTPESFLDLIVSEDRPAMQRWIAACVAGERPNDLEFRRMLPDGTVRIITSRGELQRDDADRPIQVVGTAQDITERKQAEALREHLAALVVSSEDGIISKSLDGTITAWNSGAEKLFGYSSSEVIGKPILVLLPPDRVNEEYEILARIRRGERVDHFETIRIRKDGEAIDVSVTISPIRNGTGTIIGASKIARDITPRKRLEAQLRQAQKMEVVGRFAGGVAHDFNNILAVILGYCDLSLDLVPPESPVKGHVAQIKKASLRAAVLTRQLLAFSRQQVVFPRILDLNEVVDNLTAMLLSVVGEDISVSFRPATPIGSINADRGQIEQVLMNLVVNARDAMPQGGKIVIETGPAELSEQYVAQNPGSNAGPHVVLSVRDTGCGMDEKIEAQIFEPFFTTKGIGQGSGLGLSMVYGFVKQSGGSILVYSEPGEGTTFKIYFPRAGERPEPLAYSNEEAESPRGSETILVVEDDEPLRKLAVNILQDAGYRVIEAKDAKSALSLLEVSGSEVDLLLTDVIMPEKTGVDLVAEATAVRPNLRSLFMSGYTGDVLALRGGLVPEAAFLEKPFTKNSLLTKVYSALRGESEKR